MYKEAKNGDAARRRFITIAKKPGEGASKRPSPGPARVKIDQHNQFKSMLRFASDSHLVISEEKRYLMAYPGLISGIINLRRTRTTCLLSRREDVFGAISAESYVIRLVDVKRLLSVSASRGPVFRRYPLSGRIGENETWAQGVSACDLIFRYILLITTKNKNFRILPLACYAKHGAGSVQAKQFLRKGYDCQP